MKKLIVSMLFSAILLLTSCSSSTATVGDDNTGTGDDLTSDTKSDKEGLPNLDADKLAGDEVSDISGDETADSINDSAADEKSDAKNDSQNDSQNDGITNDDLNNDGVNNDDVINDELNNDGEITDESQDLNSDETSDELNDGTTVDETPDIDNLPPFDPNADSDGDGIPNGVECATYPSCPDTDGDGIVNYLSSDSDGDGILDSVEAVNTTQTDPANPVDTDGDGQPDYIDTDSDGDSIPDAVESDSDFDKDGAPNYRDLDSDGDGVTDAVEAGQTPNNPPDSDGDGFADFVDLDSDNDGLPDSQEIYCTTIAKDSRLYADTDGDGYIDLAEKAVGSDLCNPAQGVKDFVDFYFVLPYQEPEKTDILTFAPTVRKTDIFFNMDTTYSMNEEINNLKSGLSAIMNEAKARVADSAFGVSFFQDFPLGNFGGGGDLPWSLLQGPTTDAAAAQNGVNALALGDGLDVPESGYESLYQLATGAGASVTSSYECNCDQWGSCSTCTGTYTIPAYTGGGLGGVGFRANSVPIAMHVTDASSHTPADYGAGSHSRDQAVSALNNLGIRVITVQSETTSGSGYDGTAVSQLTDISNATGARVPVCAFKTGASSWRCGDSKCCTYQGGAADPNSGMCTLSYLVPADGSSLGSSVVDGVDAIVKYGTFNVFTVPKDDGNTSTIDTSCFLKKVESLQFVSPPDEPEKSCTPVANPAAYNGSAYNNGFSNFATGTSSPSKKGSKLLFTVHAQNDTCYKPTTAEAKVFTAYIDIKDQITGAILDTQTVTIIVPGKLECSGSEGCQQKK